MRIKLIISLLVLGWSACTFTRKVQTGMQAYEVKQFSVATQLFSKEYDNSRSQQDKAILAYYAGESYTQMNDPAAAAPWYFKAHQDGFGPEALERYAEALKKQEKYGEALRTYEDLLKSSQGNAGYRSNITLCRQAMEWQKNPNPDYQITSVPFNTDASEYSAVPIGPGKLLFTSDRDVSEAGKTYLWTGRGFSDIYIKSASSDDAEPYDPVINSEDNDGTPAFTADQRTIVFTRCYVDDDYDAWCQLMISEKLGNEWSAPERLPFVMSKANYGHPAFAANGTVLFFSSDAEGGQGSHDLYYSQKDVNGTWSDPVNLGSVINTMGNEQYPTVYKDTLFFSSDRLAGLGGLDIFKTYMNAAGQWMPPINLRAPINSGADDFGFVIDTFTAARENVRVQGFFTSSRGGASRQDDIFSFEVLGPASKDVVTEIPPDTTEEEQIDYQLFLSLRVMEPEFEKKDDPNSRRVGKKPLPNGPVIVTEGLSDQRFVTDELGQLILKLEWNKQYAFTAKYRDHLAVTYELNTAEVEKDPKKPVKTISQTLELDPIFKNKEIVLENIFYDYDQWFIREDAKPSLNALSVILKNNPSIRIQLASHTDCRGTDDYNLELSQKRAQAAVDYLKSVGIPERRLVAQGFGETNPAVICECEQCSEAQHQANRRTTFTIID